MHTDKHHCQIVLHIDGLAEHQYNNILKRMSQLDERMEAISTRVDEAVTEITALLEQLRNETLSEAGRAALDNVEAKVNALADVVPNP